jgi:ABC-type multidrug transport system fused ATPase/permease subunit
MDKSQRLPPWVTLSSKGHDEKVCRIQGSFSWLPDDAPALKDVNLHIGYGEHVAVVGKVGSGKTTLLHAVLGEMLPCKDARLQIPAKLAYHAQTPYISEGTLKDNILFHEAYEEERYEQAIFGSSLRPDLEILPGGDAVPIGSRGISLSGGQRVRVSLARAVYSKASELLLLDDPFASVDANTAAHIIENLLGGPLMKHRACLVVCQAQAELLCKFDRVCVVSDGQIVSMGTPAEVCRGETFLSLQAQESIEATAMEPASEIESHSLSRGSRNEDPPSSQSSYAVKRAKTSPSEALELREQEGEGRVQWATIKHYLFTGGLLKLSTFALVMLVVMIIQLVQDVILARWMDNQVAVEIKNKLAGTSESLNLLPMFISIFCLLSAGVVLYLGGYFMGASWSFAVSTAMHDLVVKRLLRAPIDKFHDKSPVGRILNRMSVDMRQVDMQLFLQCLGTLMYFLSWCVPITFIHLALPLAFTIVSIPWYIVLFQLFFKFCNVAVPLRYLQTVSRSEVSRFFSEVQDSRITVRAYGVQDHLQREQMEATDKQTNAFYAGFCTRRWLCNRLLFCYCAFATGIALLGILAPSRVDTGVVSLCIIFAFDIFLRAEFIIDGLVQTQFELVAMHRLYEYTELPQEKPEILPNDDSLKSFTLTMKRKQLPKLAFEASDQGVQIFHVESLLSTRAGADDRKKEKVILKEDMTLPGITGFAFSSPVAAMPFLKFAPDDVNSHRLVAVNGCSADPVKMATELCSESSEDVILRFDSCWLMKGAHLQFQELVAGYGDNPINVLNQVSFEIEAQTKAAICGATGCGKSSLILSILRIIEPRGGRILINGKDTSHIGLHTLRRAVGLVPQDPVLFSETVRNNLDPFQEYSNEKLWAALDAVQMKETIASYGCDLQFQIANEGSNMSFGQRQLLCIARMVLRQPGLLLLDECTSAVDARTQELVQSAIRASFPHATLIVVAHRLETILDFDMVVVMERGRVVEQGDIKSLAGQRGGLFAKMLNAHKSALGHKPQAHESEKLEPVSQSQ